jgi:hypothetical protein
VAIAYYGSRISPNQIETAEGYLICRSVPIARTGDQQYTAREVMQDGDPGQMVIVHRRPEDVFAEETIASFEGKPVTDDHPPENVQAENFASYARGHVQNVRRAGDNLVGDVYITDAKLASDVKHRVKREISCGYQCDLVPDGAGGYYQTNIRGNHVAVVLRGRAGHDVAIHDAANTAAEGRTNTMNKFTKGVLAAFGSAAKEASPEELEAMATITATALDAAPAEEAPEADPAEKKAEPSPAKDEPMKDETVYKEQKGVDLGTKIDRVLELLEGMMKGREEKHMSDETDLDEIIEKLTGKPEDPDEAKMIGAEDAKCGAMPAATKDAAVELLRRVRPAVAAIEDKAARARVTDALLGAVKGDNAMTAIAQAAYDSAAAAAKSTSRSTFDQICAESEAAYAAMNPHKTK